MVAQTNSTSHNGHSTFDPQAWRAEYQQQHSWHQAHPAFTDTVSWVDAESCHHSVCIRTDSFEDLVAKVRQLKALVVQAKAKAPVSPPAETAAEPPDPTSFCALHGVAMKQHANAKGVWFAHRADDNSWCHGRQKK
jgi:hypothetical protein